MDRIEQGSPWRAAIGATLLLVGALAAQPDWMRARLPAGRASTAMAYDAARQRVVRFGGHDPADLNQVLGDTWEWDGIAWMQRLPATSPSARGGHAMAYDPVRERVVLFGGHDGITSLADTWEWDGVNWAQRSPASRPPARWGHAVAYDTARWQLVLFGGVGPINLGDTWVWDGVNWIQRTPTVTPPARNRHAMAYDAARQQVVLCGGDAFAPFPLSDTWVWDGVNWGQRALSASPISVGHAMVYDASRQRVVLFGGDTGFGTYNTTLEWDGFNWVLRTPATQPTPRIDHALAYDDARQRVVLFGGRDGLFPQGATWEWDGVHWVQWDPATSASPRTAHAMVYDAARQQTVVFGGMGSTPSGTVARGDTWLWDGIAWIEQTATAGPAPRASHAMAYHAGRQRVVLFGGFDLWASTLFGDTWEWDGRLWTARATPVSPPPRSSAAAAGDEARQRVVLFGGWGGLSLLFADTWEWDGTAWVQRMPATSPSARSSHAMTYDAARQRVVLFGGNDGASDLRDTWEWDGATWTQRNPPVSPGAREAHALAYDAARQRVVLSGGMDLNRYRLPDTWEWDGTTWMQTNPVASPAQRASHALAYDAVRHRVVLFGGAGYGGVLGDTWLLGDLVPAAAQSIGSACPGSNGTPVLASSVPFLGNPTFRLDLSSTRALAPCLFVLAPNTQTLNLGGGCTLYLGGFLLPLSATANAGGLAHVQLAIPGDVSLRGASAYAQGLVFDPMGPVAGLALSAGCRLAIGD